MQANLIIISTWSYLRISTISVFFVEKSFPAGIYCTLYIFWMASLQGRSWRSGQPGRWVNPPQSPSDILSITSFPQFLFFLTSHQIDLALALSHLVRDGRWPIPCPSGTKLATRAGRNLDGQPLLRVAIIVLEQEINLNVVASSALVRLWVCGCTEAVSPSECQCGPQVWRPSWAMGASSNLPTDAEAATPGSSRFPRTTTPSIPPTCISGKPTRKGIYERFAGEFWWTPVRFMLHGTETG